MLSFSIKEKYRVEDLLTLVGRLRDPIDGCPWDKVQTHNSIRQNFIEETYEAVEAIDRGDDRMLEEELGDVLLQVALQAEIAKQRGAFDIDDVADTICKKLVFRHPHIFGGLAADTPEAVLSNWEDIKRDEKSQKTGSDAIDDVPNSLPTLMRSQKIQKRAAYVGFDYPAIGMAMDDLEGEMAELRRAIAGDGDVFEEVGDLIFSAVNIARLQGFDADLAAERACDKFSERFRVVEGMAKEQGIDMKTCGIDRLNTLWFKAKEALKNAD